MFRFMVTLCFAGRVEAEAFGTREEAWGAFMAAGKRPEVKSASFEPCAVKSAWKAGALAIERARELA